MNVGNKVRITPEAWTNFMVVHGPQAGARRNDMTREITEIRETSEGTRIMLRFPVFSWKPDDLVLASPLAEVDADHPSKEWVTRAFCAVMEMWGRRYDYDSADLDELKPVEGEEFLGPVLVDLGQLSVAHTSLMSALKEVNPELYDSFFNYGGTPDAPLPEPVPSNVTNLDDVRIRTDKEFEGEQVAYVEALWGKNTYAYNAAIRDLEGMRRGSDDGTLRRPATYYEGRLLVEHTRALANDLARNFGMDHLVRPDDDLGEK